MKNIPLLIGTLLGTIILIVGVVFFFSQDTSQPTEPVDQALVTGEARLVRGSAEAPVTIVEFSDFQCPACAGAQPLVKQVLETYPDEVRLVYRHMPLVSIHQHAQLTAQAAEAAHQEGKFWEMHDLLFERQAVWSALEKEEEIRELLASYAEELAIDKTSFLERIESEDIKAVINKDVADAGTLRVSATPTFYVNGQPVPASQQLLSIVESEINKLK